MASVFDVAKLILESQGRMTTMKLQKLVYYSQAWSLAWTGEALFDEKIRAWCEGPVVGTLHFEHKGWRTIDFSELRQGAPVNLTEAQKTIVGAVVGFYGRLNPEELSVLTHQESPWVDARGTLGPKDHGNEEITRDAMRAFYRAIAGAPGSPPSPTLLKHLAEGIEDARAGRTVSRGSFEQYLED